MLQCKDIIIHLAEYTRAIPLKPKPRVFDIRDFFVFVAVDGVSHYTWSLSRRALPECSGADADVRTEASNRIQITGGVAKVSPAIVLRASAPVNYFYGHHNKTIPSIVTKSLVFRNLYVF